MESGAEAKTGAAEARDAKAAPTWLRVPDAVATSPEGLTVAVEVERSAKTPKRYQAIMADYLQMRKAGTVSVVHYVCETDRLAAGLARLFQAIQTVNIKGVEVALKPEHYEAFKFFGPGWLFD